jgi:hypothetical protein
LSEKGLAQWACCSDGAFSALLLRLPFRFR